MKTAAELLSELNELDEHVSIDAKTASDAGRSLLETICAFSNEPGLGGGYILLGVTRADDTLWPAYEAVGVRDPDKLQSDRTGNGFLAILLFHHFLSREDLDWLATFGDLNLSDDEMKALVSAREVGAIDNHAYRNLNRGADTLTASRHLRRLCDSGLLRKKGRGNATYYVPTDRLLSGWNDVQSREPDVKPGESAGKSREFQPKSREFPAESGESTFDPWISSRLDLLQAMPAELRAEVAVLPKKVETERLRRVVWKVCSWRDLPIVAIGKIVERSQNYLQSRVVSPMLRDGELAFSIPDEPNHPRQTYGAVESTSSSD